jgi:hypothetical protein
VFWRWHGVAAALAAATLSACAAAPPPASDAALELERAISAGLELYEAREFAVAAERFGEAARLADGHGAADTARAALTAECTAWLRARLLPEFAACTDALGALHRGASRPDPGLGTLLAMGAIAGERPAPPFRVPSEVAPILDAAAREEAP